MVSERVTFETDDGLQIEGLLHLPEATPAPAIVVCHPHPQYGGEMRNNVVDAICKAALDQGIGALRFNFRGVGGSEGQYGGGVAERKDVAAALAYLGGRRRSTHLASALRVTRLARRWRCGRQRGA